MSRLQHLLQCYADVSMAIVRQALPPQAVWHDVFQRLFQRV